MDRHGRNSTVLRPVEALAAIDDTDAVGVLFDRPVVAVAVDDSPAFAELVLRAAKLPCVFVAVGASNASASAPRLDVDVADADELDTLVAGVERSTEASVALVQLLRLGDQLDLEGALVAESLVYGLLQSGARFRTWLADQPARTHCDVADPVTVERVGATLCCTLARPAVRNAFDAATRDALVEALAVATADRTIAHVEFRGAGPDFCAGGDLSEFGHAPDPVVGHLVRTSRSAGAVLASIAGRTTAFVHGACVGSGIELPAFAGRIVAAPDTRISLPEVAMGLIPGAGGTVSLARRIGRRRTAWLALTSATIDATTALDWGLVDELGPDPKAGGLSSLGSTHHSG